MNHANGVDGLRESRQSLSATPLAASRGAGASPAGIRWGLPGTASRNRPAEEIAEDPAKLRLAGRLISWATAGSDVRFEKVAALRQAIEAGTYKVSAAELAEKLMDGMRG